VLVVRGAGDQRLHLLLVDGEGRTNGRALLPFLAEPVEVTGRVLRYENLLVLRADPAAIRRL
jgi:hypothetical protein